MAANYLHGIETIEIDNGLRPIKVVKSAVIGLVGTAPTGPTQKPILVLSEKDAAQFGAQHLGFTIPQALDAIFDHGAGTVIVINAFDEKKHLSDVADEAVTLVNHQLQLAHALVSNVVLKSADGSNQYQLNTDFVLDEEKGTITPVAGGAITKATIDFKVSYTYKDPTKVVLGDIIGAVNEAGFRTGLKALDDTYNLFGFTPKILIAPVYCTQTSISTELIALAEKLDAIAYIDAPIGTTFQQAIEGRGPNGVINFNTSSERVKLCYPHVKVFDPVLNQERLEPLSQRLAGLRAKIDNDRGYWWSTSNNELAGVIGMERPLSAMIDDPQSEVNLLNESGITTVFNSYGTGLRAWGNRTAAWPTVTHMKNFENVRRTGDIINESIRYSSLQFIDRPIDDALIDAIVESCNGFGRKLIGDGALLGFKAWYDPARNPETELALGHLLINYKYTVPPPLERLTYETEIVSEYLLTLGSGGN